jgi:hypothetical protein
MISPALREGLDWYEPGSAPASCSRRIGTLIVILIVLERSATAEFRPDPPVARFRAATGQQDVNRLGHASELLAFVGGRGFVDQLGCSVELVTLQVDPPP